MKKIYDLFFTGELYHRFETVITVILSVAIGLIIVLSLFRLALAVGAVFTGHFNAMDYETFRVIFGMIMTVLVALEFGNSVVRAINTREAVVVVDGIVLIGILTIVRKLIIAEITDVSELHLLGMAAVLVALALLYWVLRQTRKPPANEAHIEKS